MRAKPRHIAAIAKVADEEQAVGVPQVQGRLKVPIVQHAGANITANEGDAAAFFYFCLWLLSLTACT
jgi:hypothetical protein